MMSPTPTTLLKILHGSIKLEHEIHKKFDHLREHGEWFRPDEKLLNFLENEETYIIRELMKEVAAEANQLYHKRRSRLKNQPEEIEKNRASVASDDFSFPGPSVVAERPGVSRCFTGVEGTDQYMDFYNDSSFSDFSPDGEGVIADHRLKKSSSRSISNSDEDPYLECLDYINQITSFLETALPRSTVQHKLDDGRTICIYKDKNCTLWYNWRPSSGRFTSQIRLK